MEMTIGEGNRNPFAMPALTAWAGRLGLEAVDFFGDRLRKDFAAGEAVFGCRSFDELAKVQRGWLEGAVEDYAQEVTKVLELTADAVRAGAKA
jgi:hypothetical protein